MQARIGEDRSDYASDISRGNRRGLAASKWQFDATTLASGGKGSPGTPSALGDAAELDESRLVSGAVVREFQRPRPRCSPASLLRRSRATHTVRRWLPAKSSAHVARRA